MTTQTHSWKSIMRRAGTVTVEQLERVANMDQPTGEPCKVVELQGLDKIASAIRRLQGQIVQVDGDEHALLLEFQGIETDYQKRFDALKQKRDGLLNDLHQLQSKIVDGVKPCGIRAEIVPPAPPISESKP